MITVSRTVTLAGLLAAMTLSISAQTPRDPRATGTRETAASVAPYTGTSIKTKYEGGVVGYPQKREGTLNFDDMNRRLVFRDKKNAELFSIPYDAIRVAYTDVRSRTSTTGTVISSVPTPFGVGQLGRLIKTKKRYLAMQYRDDEAGVFGTTSFKIDNQQILLAILESVGRKAEMTRRGEIFIRPRGDRDAGDRREIRETVTLPPPM